MHMYHFAFFVVALSFFSAGAEFFGVVSSAMQSEDPSVGVLSAVCGVHGTSVARAMAAESRKNWLSFAG